MWKQAIVYAQESGQDGGGGPGSPFGNMFPFMILMFAIFYFLLIRPQTKRERARKEMLASLSKGKSVVTSGGICGTIVGLNEKTVVLKVSDDPVTKMEFVRGAISQIEPEDADDKD